MENKGTISFGPGDVQVFEVTMDNDEDQEELNRLLRKPGEPPYCPPTKSVDAGTPRLTALASQLRSRTGANKKMKLRGWS